MVKVTVDIGDDSTIIESLIVIEKIAQNKETSIEDVNALIDITQSGVDQLSTGERPNESTETILTSLNNSINQIKE
ncbi:MAG: hypothetical protein F6K08_24145 [Okeania sp. SIO1H6]|nr:hypothetical protein [Okeania sp. SIO1H6]